MRSFTDKSMGFGLLLLGLVACSGDETPAPAPDASSTDIVTVDTNSNPTPSDPCEGKDDGVACDDNDPCTLEDKCSGGACTGGINNPCDTQEQCEVGVCIPGEGCQITPLADGTECSVACFNTAKCLAGKCEVDSKDYIQCGDPGPDQPCVAEILCEPTTGECEKLLTREEGASCDTDGNLCSLETCDADATCQPTGQTEGCDTEKQTEPCQVWVCQPETGNCKATGFAGEISCSDGNACTSNDTCTQDNFGFVTCKGIPLPVDDLNPCTDDSCSAGVVTHAPIDGIVCDPQDVCSPTGLCEAGACIPTKSCECNFDADCPQPENKCLGTSFCNTSGVNNVCEIIPGTPVVCDPSDKLCFVSQCDPSKGTCFDDPVSNGVPCEDGNPCTAFDSCIGGVCTGSQAVDCDNGLFCDGAEACDPAIGCVPGTAPNIDDGIDCTLDSCDNLSGQVIHAPDPGSCAVGLCEIALCDLEKGCVVESESNCCGNEIIEEGETCDDGNNVGGDGCSSTCENEAGPPDCQGVLDADGSAENGFYLIDPGGVDDGAGYQVFCEMKLENGGWTLVLVASDDGKNTWTWTNRHLFDSDETTVGELGALDQDYKSLALHDVKADELLFVHAPSGVWARYDISAASGQSLAQVITNIGGPNDYPGPNDGFPLKAGTITESGNLCSLRLYFNVKDVDGSKDDHSWGPTWKVKNNEFCGFDDPGWRGSLGPHADLKQNNGVDAQNIEYDALGFGWGLGLNTAPAGTGGNHLKVYVRRK